MNTNLYLLHGQQAGGAATSKLQRFSVEQGQKILRSIKDFNVPNTQEEFDRFHRENREIIIAEALNLELAFTHGIAAKLINIFYKSIYVCDASTHEGLKSIIHPPIDSLLLKSLSDNNVGEIGERFKISHNQRWSKFTSSQYENVIANIKIIMDGKPLWMVEQYWIGFQ